MVLAGGSCALLMQAAHPVVAAGVFEHSTYATDPFGRLRRTLSTSFDVVFGTRSRAEAAIRRVNGIHRSVSGARHDDGSPYTALDPEALLWVHATLIDTALRVYDRFVARLTPADEQAYHAEAGAGRASCSACPARSCPPTIVELRAWMAGMIDDGRVRVTPAAREIARTVLYPAPWLPRVAWDMAHAVSIATLPDALRRQYGIPWSPARERGIAALAAVTPSRPSARATAAAIRPARADGGASRPSGGRGRR